MVNWFHEPSSSYVTIVFNFSEKKVCGSAILESRSENQGTMFDNSIIKDFLLVTN